MCWVAAIPYVMAAVAAYGSYRSSEAQQDAAIYQSKVAENNAKLAAYQEQDAKARGEQAAQDKRRKYAALLGTQRASLAARGLDISDGSANAMLEDTSYFGAYDENTIRANAAREAWGYASKRQGFLNDSAAYQAQADNINPTLNAAVSGVSAYFGSPYAGQSMTATGQVFNSGGSTMVTGATPVASKWYGTNGYSGMPTVGNVG